MILKFEVDVPLVKRTMIEQGITAPELASQAGITYQTLRRFLNNKKYGQSLRTCRKIARALQIEVETFVRAK
jgi:DNA-binding XRE family transcriptional regulator